ncbi:hypothetical protein COSO111634_38070 [Corallococcus soli]
MLEPTSLMMMVSGGYGMVSPSLDTSCWSTPRRGSTSTYLILNSLVIICSFVVYGVDSSTIVGMGFCFAERLSTIFRKRPYG